MSRPKLRSPDQSWPVWLLLGLYESAASLRLAVVLLFLLATVLAWATFVESAFGSAGSRFGVYYTWWFSLLLALLAVNVLAAALIRFPWKRHQTGFVITHAGILVLLAGCWLSTGGIDAQMPIFEGRTGHLAYEDGLHFRIEIERDGKPGTIQAPFATGPFNWSDYGSSPLPWGNGEDELFWFPWRLSRIDRGVVYDQGGIRLEAVDYLSDSGLRRAEPLELRAQVRPKKSAGGAWETVALNVRDPFNPHGEMGERRATSRHELTGGGRITYQIARSQAEVDAFLKSAPKPPLSPAGQLVLTARGQQFHVGVPELAGGSKFPLGKTGLSVRMTSWDPSLLVAQLEVSGPKGATSETMLLVADAPEFNRPASRLGVFGAYWFDAAHAASLGTVQGQQALLRDLDKPRVDILQGVDGGLYYRAWLSPKLLGAGRLPADGREQPVLDAGDSTLVLRIERFSPHDVPGFTVIPIDFDRKKDDGMKEGRARVRLTVDGRSEDFWIAAMPPDPDAEPGDEQERAVEGQGRRVRITLQRDHVDVGFRLKLLKFERRLDPGTSQPSYYASLVDLLPRHGGDEKLNEEPILITLNHPVNFTDPTTGRSYRIYQEAFRGPFKPGEPIFEHIVAGREARDELFMSWLTVNYDPGRGLKYAGALVMVLGVVTMFYMRAYFFRRRESEAGDRR